MTLSVEELRRLRSEIRWVEFGRYGETGGGCSIVSEEVSLTAGIEIDAGCYIAADGEHIAHVWNLLPTGRILDVTADQFGDGSDIRITGADDPRYTPGCECEGAS